MTALFGAVATGTTGLYSWIELGTTLLGFGGALCSFTLAFLLLLNYVRKTYFAKKDDE
jgi:hypothetical protein